MAHYLYGERKAREGTVMLGCSAWILDQSGTRVLLTRRADNGRWCLPGGKLDAGESVTECIEREVREETGLIVQATHLIGVYSNQHILLRYADGNQFHIISLHFATKTLGGELGLSNETTEYGYFSADDLSQIDVIEPHRQRIAESWNVGVETLIR